MGVISRKLFPACGKMCVCCPALRPRSQHPVKRYKKLLSDIFPKSPDGPPNDRKIDKLCEYAAKNPIRIPKIAKYLEERCYKELRNGRIKFINIVTVAYNKMLCMCKEQMVYFSGSLLNVVSELLDNSKQESVQILGCQTLTRFIYSQVDGTYTHDIEKYVHKVCKLAGKNGEHQRQSLRASSLQCLSAMVWFMAEFSYIYAAFNEIVNATLDNYELDTHARCDNPSAETHHNSVDEVVKCEDKDALVSNDASPSYLITRPRPDKKDPSLLTREENEMPKIWSQICIQRMVELAKESTTMRQVLDPMFIYFDSRQHWNPREGLAVSVLSHMSYLMESSGSQLLLLAAVIRHLDHKNTVHDPKLQSHIVQVAAALARQIRLQGVLAEISFVSDLCRHLRKSFQATLELAGEQQSNLNIILQNSIEDCLLEIAKGIGDPRPLFDMMAITLENLSSSGIVARATIGSLMILAQMISLVLESSHSQQVFPEELLVQLMKVMLHPNVEVRVGAHQIFSALLIPNKSHKRVSSLLFGYSCDPRTLHFNNASAFAYIPALLKKIRRENDGTKVGKNGYNVHEDFGRDNEEGDKRHAHFRKDSANSYTSRVDRKGGSTMAEGEPYIMKRTEDQIVQLLSGFWLQATLPDNLPSNFEAISHSFVLTLISLWTKNLDGNLIVCLFQLLLSLRNVSLDLNNGALPPVCQRSILVLSMGMLMFAAKIYHISDLIDLLKSLMPLDVDPFLGISDDLQVFVRPDADLRGYGSATDNKMASSLLFELRDKISESSEAVMDILVQKLSTITELEEAILRKQLFEPFTPDDALMFGPQSMLDLERNQIISYSKESLSFDEDILASSLVEDDVKSEASVADLSRFIPKIPPSPSISHVISIGQLLESALEVAGQVATTPVSSSGLPYNTMASQCEALGTGTRKKLSNWLTPETPHKSSADDRLLPEVPADECIEIRRITSNGLSTKGALVPAEQCCAIRLPPSSPFDNFLKAAGC
ncbi:hypothetical protein SLEP1_g5046 [Rubroshorea leprosula]|uniref:ARM repeat superfamily protein n=1 Tax=Rubroshorea leprosula TaxID=152421 RepID=A0AAV5HWM8_9ROSI|nr:hypothetical protein SLEP1_g5046 [Rubroshorea leprosula]